MTNKCDDILHNILDKYIKNAKPSRHINLSYKLSNQTNKVKNKVKVDLYQTTREHYIIQLKTHTELGRFNYWLYSNLMENINEDYNECVSTIVIQQTHTDQEVIMMFAKQIKTAMESKCSPYLILTVIFDDEVDELDNNNNIQHENTVIIEFSSDYRNIHFTIFEPHGTANIEHSLNYIDKYLEQIRGLFLNAGFADNININWGCKPIGIQSEDNVGMCSIFNSFWIWITLQLRPCLPNKNDFISNVSCKGITYLLKHTKDKKHAYNVIASWAHIKLLQFINVMESESKKFEEKYSTPPFILSFNNTLIDNIMEGCKRFPEICKFESVLITTQEYKNKNNILKKGDEKNPLPEYSRSILYDV